MSTEAYLIVKREDGKYVHVYVNYDGFPEHMLPALSEITPNQVLRAKEIRSIDKRDGIEAYGNPKAPIVNETPITDMTSYTYLWKNGRWTIYSRPRRSQW